MTEDNAPFPRKTLAMWHWLMWGGGFLMMLMAICVAASYVDWVEGHPMRLTKPVREVPRVDPLQDSAIGLSPSMVESTTK